MISSGAVTLCGGVTLWRSYSTERMSYSVEEILRGGRSYSAEELLRGELLRGVGTLERTHMHEA